MCCLAYGLMTLLLGARTTEVFIINTFINVYLNTMLAKYKIPIITILWYKYKHLTSAYKQLLPVLATCILDLSRAVNYPRAV